MYNSTMQAHSAPRSPVITSPVPLVPAAGRAGGFRANRRPARRRPLPDAVAITSVAVPDPAPPYDDAAGHGRRTTSESRRRPSGRAGQGTRSRLAAVGASATADARTGPAQYLRAVAPGTSQAQFAESDQVPVTGSWPGQFAQVLAETLAGARPPEQIVPWTTEQARQRISQLGPLLAAAHRPRVRRVIVTSPARGVLEMTVIVGLGTSVRALAVRLERAQPPGQDQHADGPAERRQPTGQSERDRQRLEGQGRPEHRTRPEHRARPEGTELAGHPNPARSALQGPAVSVSRSYRGRHPEAGAWLCTAVEAA